MCWHVMSYEINFYINLARRLNLTIRDNNTDDIVPFRVLRLTRSSVFGLRNRDGKFNMIGYLSSTDSQKMKDIIDRRVDVINVMRTTVHNHLLVIRCIHSCEVWILHCLKNISLVSLVSICD